MINARSRLNSLVAHFLPTPSSPGLAQHQHHNNFHSLSPTLFLPRAALIEPNVGISASMMNHLTETLAG